jgi:hypothetical protein
MLRAVFRGQAALVAAIGIHQADLVVGAGFEHLANIDDFAITGRNQARGVGDAKVTGAGPRAVTRFLPGGAGGKNNGGISGGRDNHHPAT